VWRTVAGMSQQPAVAAASIHIQLPEGRGAGKEGCGRLHRLQRSDRHGGGCQPVTPRHHHLSQPSNQLVGEPPRLMQLLALNGLV
jgi:hypothetical protein